MNCILLIFLSGVPDYYCANSNLSMLLCSFYLPCKKNKSFFITVKKSVSVVKGISDYRTLLNVTCDRLSNRNSCKCSTSR